MKHLKQIYDEELYEQNIYSIDYNSIVKFFNKIIKKIDDKYYKHSVHLSNNFRISLYENSDSDFTEIISQICLNNTNNVLIFEVYAPKYVINDMIIKYFSMSMKLIYKKDNVYSFKFDRNTKLNTKYFEILLNSNKYNL